MPLRASIANPAMAAQSRSFAFSSEIKELPEDEANDVLFSTLYGLRTIELNRPKKLNSLNGSMARKIIPRLREWENSQLANVLVIKGAGRAFCAGGDVAALAQQNRLGEAGQRASTDYFALEYKLDHLIATCTKPYVAYMDGITMGGGVGLSVHAPFRIATENTVFAMPETTIGFFPDVGASFFLPKLDGKLGMYLALTSQQLKGADVFYSGVATHYLHSSSLPDLSQRLAELQFRDYDALPHRLRIINATIEEFCTGLPASQPAPSPVRGVIREAIDYAFQHALTLPQILDTLQELEGLHPESRGYKTVPSWAAATRQTILQRSPTSVRVTFKQLRAGRQWSIAETFRREHGMAARFMAHADFTEGVTARLVTKPAATPVWNPGAILDVSDDAVDAFFVAHSDLELLRSGAGADYYDYPHSWSGLPREREIESAVMEGGLTREGVVEQFVQRSGGKMGVREKVEEVVGRKFNAEGGVLRWKD